jgi:hypothetical protein
LCFREDKEDQVSPWRAAKAIVDFAAEAKIDDIHVNSFIILAKSKDAEILASGKKTKQKIPDSKKKFVLSFQI